MPDRSQQRIEQIIRHVFHDDQARALCIAGYESTGTRGRFNARAVNGSNTGLFEIDRETWDWTINPRALAVVGRVVWARMHEALYNARVARRIWLHSGWAPWSTRGLCGA